MPNHSNDVQIAEQITSAYHSLRAELQNIIVGQDDILEQLMIALLARGHCLLVGVPGLAKTLIIRSLAEVLGLDFARIQFTPDLMPSDITGTEILEEDKSSGQKAFRFLKGPVFANLVLADEINRTPPKTQSALLEAMQEYKVTAAGRSLTLDPPFFVLATQNPIEQEGTYPLPEAQLDRFMFSLWLDYPPFEQEKEIVRRTTGGAAPRLSTIISRDQILQFQDLVQRVPVADSVVEQAVKLAAASRPQNADADSKVREWVRWGAGPRASQYLVLAAKVRALLKQRFAPETEDLVAVALPVLRHRLVLSYNAEAAGRDVRGVVDYLLQQYGLS